MVNRSIRTIKAVCLTRNPVIAGATSNIQNPRSSNTSPMPVSSHRRPFPICSSACRNKPLSMLPSLSVPFRRLSPRLALSSLHLPPRLTT
jgi:hypothetical protein